VSRTPDKPSFKQGQKFVGNKAIKAKYRLITHGSDGVTVYTATLWEDGTTSCNCPAWRFQKSSSERGCKHATRARFLDQDVDETGMSNRTPAAKEEPSYGTTPFKRRTRSVDT